MDKRKLKKIILYILVITLFFIIMSIIFSFHAIYTGVKKICVEARREFGQDCTNSLVLFIKSDDHTLKEKRHAVWALGQLAEERSIPFLKQFQETYQCSDDPKKSKMCYEIFKALKWCEHGNATNWMYKNKEKW